MKTPEHRSQTWDEDRLTELGQQCDPHVVYGDHETTQDEYLSSDEITSKIAREQRVEDDAHCSECSGKLVYDDGEHYCSQCYVVQDEAVTLDMEEDSRWLQKEDESPIATAQIPDKDYQFTHSAEESNVSRTTFHAFDTSIGDITGFFKFKRLHKYQSGNDKQWDERGVDESYRDKSRRAQALVSTAGYAHEEISDFMGRTNLGAINQPGIGRHLREYECTVVVTACILGLDAAKTVARRTTIQTDSSNWEQEDTTETIDKFSNPSKAINYVAEEVAAAQ